MPFFYAFLYFIYITCMYFDEFDVIDACFAVIIIIFYYPISILSD